MTDFPVFDANGKMLGNQTSAQGQAPSSNSLDDIASAWSTIPDYLSSLPSSFAPSATSNGNVVTSQGGTSTGGSVGSTGASAGTPSNAAASAQPVAASGVTSGSIADYFLRAVVIILGFIFVAIGLNMFKPGIVPNPVNLVRH